MFKDDLFDDWLDKKAKETIVKIGDGQTLSSEEMILLVLKAQTNHFVHLDEELRVDMQTLNKSLHEEMQTLNRELRDEMQTLNKDLNEKMQTLNKELRRETQILREDMDKRFEQVDKRFDAVIARMDRFMVWSLGLTLSSTLFILGFMYKFTGH